MKHFKRLYKMFKFSVFSIFISFHFVILLLLCFLCIYAEHYDSIPSNTTSLHLAESDISDAIGGTSIMPHESKKSKVKKRPGAPPIPEPDTIISDSESISDSINVNCVNLKLKNSKVSPRKGACNPPLDNDLSKLNDSFSNVDKSELIGSNNTVNNTEVIKVINKTETLHSQNNSNLNVDTVNLTNLHNEDNESFSIITTTSTSAPVPQIINSTNVPDTFNSTNDKTNVTSASVMEDGVDTNSTVSAVTSELQNLTASSKKPFTSASGGKKSNVWIIVGAILTVLIICSLVGFVAYKRLYAYWDRRHYSRMDFLIDGLYEM